MMEYNKALQNAGVLLARAAHWVSHQFAGRTGWRLRRPEGLQ